MRRRAKAWRTAGRPSSARLERAASGWRHSRPSSPATATRSRLSRSRTRAFPPPLTGESAPCRRGRWPRFLSLADALNERVYKTAKNPSPRGRGAGVRGRRDPSRLRRDPSSVALRAASSRTAEGAPCRRGRWPRFLSPADALNERVYKSAKNPSPKGRGAGVRG